MLFAFKTVQFENHPGFQSDQKHQTHQRDFAQAHRVGVIHENHLPHRDHKIFQRQGDQDKQHNIQRG